VFGSFGCLDEQGMDRFLEGVAAGGDGGMQDQLLSLSDLLVEVVDITVEAGLVGDSNYSCFATAKTVKRPLW
jgi:hypothetical protein